MQTVVVQEAMLLPGFTASADAFMERLKTVPGTAFNRVPFDGSWSPAQVGDHVHKFLGGIDAALRMPRAEPDRAPDAHEPLLREIFLNFDRKSKAPVIVEPSKDRIEKEELITALAQITGTLCIRISEGNLLARCVGLPFPTIGDMTGMEWVLFGDYHLQRHTHQLEQMQPFFNKV